MKITQQKNVWKTLTVILWIIIVFLSFRIGDWEVDAKPGFSLLTYWVGAFLGILLGIISMKLRYLYKT
jgi:Ca2+/Na+ antiporter